MELYQFKNQYYFSIEECIRESGIKILQKDISNEILKTLNIKKVSLENSQLNQIIKDRVSSTIKRRNLFLNKTDKYMLSDYPIGQIDLLNVMSYRQYLRDYTKIKDYWQKYPMSLEEWQKNTQFLK